MSSRCRYSNAQKREHFETAGDTHNCGNWKGYEGCRRRPGRYPGDGKRILPHHSESLRKNSELRKFDSAEFARLVPESDRGSCAAGKEVLTGVGDSNENQSTNYQISAVNGHP